MEAPKRRPGAPEQRLKIQGDWSAAVRKAFKAPAEHPRSKPAKGKPKN